MKYARGTPWRFIAANAVGAGALLAFTIAVVFAAGTWPYARAIDLVLLLLTALAIGWLDVLLLFFRDPERRAGDGLVSPADGVVKEASLAGGAARVSIFLGVFDVHVVRAPLGGAVARVEHRHGGRRFAFSKESANNERVEIEIAGDGGGAALTLIAGAFADRIVPYVKPGDAVAKGERLGIIKFGSRVDVSVPAPATMSLRVKPGDKVKAGETTLLAPLAEAPAP